MSAPASPKAAEPTSAGPGLDLHASAIAGISLALAELGDDASVPRNVRRGAVAAREELEKRGVAMDVRIASAVYVLDDLANDPNVPTHGRTAIWSILSRLESLK